MNQRKSGVILSYVTLFVKISVALVYTPFLIHSLGKSEYGIFNITASILSYMAILDFGVNDSTIRYLVKIKNHLSEKNSLRILASINLFYTGIGIVIIGIGYFIYHYLDIIFGKSMDITEISLLKTTFIIALSSTLFTIIMNPISAILMAFEKFAFLKWLELISYLIVTFLIVIFLHLEYKLIAVVCISSIVNVLVVVYKIWYVKKKLKFPYSFFKFSSKDTRMLLSYSSPIFIGIVVEQIYWKLDNILIGSYLGANMVAIYAAGIFFQKYILNFSTSISRVVTPDFINKLDQNINLKDISQLYTKISRIQLMSIMFIVTSLLFYGEDFILLWLGEEFNLSYFVLLSIMIPISFEVVGNIRNTVLQVRGLYWYRAGIILTVSIINIGCTIYVLNVYQSVIGAALSTGIGIILGNISINIFMHQKRLLDIKYFIIHTWLKMIPSILILVFSFYGLRFIKTDNWFLFTVKLGVHLLICFLILYLLYMNRQEKHIIKKLLKQIII